MTDLPLQQSVLRVFVGGTPAQELPTKVLEGSIRSRLASNWRLELVRLWDYAHMVPKVTRKAARPRTPFSFYRFLIPELCGFSGRAVYMDSDMVALGDLSPLGTVPFMGSRVVCPPRDPRGAQFALFVVDCSVGWQIGAFIAGLNSGALTYSSAMALKWTGPVRAILPQKWNDLDCMRHDTRVIHYTDMARQPWLRAGHPFGGPWLAELRKVCSEDDVLAAIRSGDVRPSLIKEYRCERYSRDIDSGFVPKHLGL
jgi:hypothetical protein